MWRVPYHKGRADALERVVANLLFDKYDTRDKVLQLSNAVTDVNERYDEEYARRIFGDWYDIVAERHLRRTFESNKVEKIRQKRTIRVFFAWRSTIREAVDLQHRRCMSTSSKMQRALRVRKRRILFTWRLTTRDNMLDRFASLISIRNTVTSVAVQANLAIESPERVASCMARRIAHRLTKRCFDRWKRTISRIKKTFEDKLAIANDEIIMLTAQLENAEIALSAAHKHAIRMNDELRTIVHARDDLERRLMVASKCIDAMRKMHTWHPQPHVVARVDDVNGTQSSTVGYLVEMTDEQRNITADYACKLLEFTASERMAHAITYKKVE